MSGAWFECLRAWMFHREGHETYWSLTIAPRRLPCCCCLFPNSAATLLEVRRVPDLGLLRQRYAEDRLFVIRMKRRSISVGVLDLIPLEAAASNDQQQQQGKPGGAAEKPAAAKICGSGPAGAGGGLLDF